MSSWSPAQYLKFADERSRAARDLVVAVPLAEVRRAGEGEPAQRSPRSQAT